MTDDSQFVLDEATESMDNTIKHLEHEFQGIRAGKASPAMLNGVMVEYYGTVVPIEQTANIGCTDARMIVVQPFDKSALNNIAKAILNANLGFNPNKLIETTEKTATIQQTNFPTSKNCFFLRPNSIDLWLKILNLY